MHGWLFICSPFLCPFASDEQQCLGYPARQEAKERRIQLPARKTARATSAEKSPPVVRQPSGGRVYRKPREEYEKELAEGAGRRRTSAQ